LRYSLHSAPFFNPTRKSSLVGLDAAIFEWLGRVINQSPYMVERACCSPMWWP